MIWGARIRRPRPKNSRPFGIRVYGLLAGLLATTDGVADGCAYAKDFIAAEDVGVVDDVIVVNLRAHENVVPHVVTDAAAKMHQEVVLAGEIVAGVAVGAIGQIEARALPADAAQEIRAELLAQVGLIIQVEVRGDRTKRLTLIASL